MAKFEEKTINDNIYKIMLLTPMDQTLFAAQVGQCLSPVLSSGDLSLDKLRAKAKEKPEELLPLLADVLPKIDAEKLHQLASKALLGNIFCGNNKCNNEDELNKHLEANPKDAFQLMMWAIGVNVGVFFG